jgi:hypothetical protein
MLSEARCDAPIVHTAETDEAVWDVAAARRAKAARDAFAAFAPARDPPQVDLAWDDPA